MKEIPVHQILHQVFAVRFACIGVRSILYFCEIRNYPQFVNEKKSTPDEQYMQRCFQLAAMGESYVTPNPKVGAVLVYNDRIIGEGYHQEFGKAHAEVNCINSVKETDKHLIAQSTLYVSLEPCSHYGKTPPCVNLILQHNIPRVVISVQDIFEKVNGSGIEKLRQHGVEVVTDILIEEGENLIKHFLHYHRYMRPYITLKWAQSADGYLGAKGEKIAISNVESRYFLHQLRTTHQAILVGKNTVYNDNPSLTVRFANGKNPLRIVLGSPDGIPENYAVFNEASPTIFISKNDSENLSSLMRLLYEKQISSVLVEGGAQILNSFIREQLWDEAFVYYSNKNLQSALHDKISAPAIQGKIAEIMKFEGDVVINYIPAKNFS